MSRDLDVACARVMGWTDIQAHTDRIGTPPDWAQGRDLQGQIGDIPYYSDDDVGLLEDEIERRKLQDAYVRRLGIMETSAAYEEAREAYGWELIRATPEQRARAFLEVMKD